LHRHRLLIVAAITPATQA